MHESINKLKKYFETLVKIYQFKPGDIVKWKPSLRNRRFPKDNEPAIVIEFLKEPFLNSKAESYSSSFMESLDVKIGFEDEDKDFAVAVFDSKRFMPFNE